ncbi:hypothetical protein BS17DRAFT_806802 [Gyrodon lividus]|nr:hypothetical protein BS17DRAFT_806802 [Gyrodon lividus]
MFSRITPIILALLAITSTAAATYDCQTACCQTASLAPTGYQGTGCTVIQPDDTCAYKKFCCYIIEGDRAEVPIERESRTLPPHSRLASVIVTKQHPEDIMLQRRTGEGVTCLTRGDLTGLAIHRNGLGIMNGWGKDWGRKKDRFRRTQFLPTNARSRLE